MKRLLMIMILCQPLSHAVAQGSNMQCGKAKFLVHSSALSPDDTLELRVWADVVGYEFRNPYKTYRATKTNGSYHFMLDSVAPASRMSLHLGYQRKKGKPAHGILTLLVIDPGDSVTLSLSPKRGVMRGGGYDSGDPIMLANWECSFTGRGADKFNAAYAAYLMSAVAFNSPDVNPIKNNPVKSLQWHLSRVDSLDREAHLRLDRYERSIRPATYRLMLADIHGLYGHTRIYMLERMLLAHRAASPVRDSILTWCKEEFARNAKFADAFSEVLASSPNAIECLEKSHELAYHVESGNYDLVSLYAVMKKLPLETAAKDKVLTLLLKRRFHRNPLRSLFEDAQNTITDPYCRELLADLDHVIAGNRALNFSLPDANGNNPAALKAC
ncbi:hypothetical protein [Parapedobacter sp. 10938]|uniref:hypothetical protein n=1 Tax=Parapedobacter flavus TaxID=3110225 RepID=UPI002DBB2437|nr:hypothetical protein [Parapedobacter sp. 10938]MEC3879325.1 hypothetical protein [Parapedobacter sp. 10938]